jgi:hypothetical protein
VRMEGRALVGGSSMRIHLGALLVLAPAAPVAGAGELVFVGSSIAGTADPSYFVDLGLGAVAYCDGREETDNVSGAAWDRAEERLYVASARTVSCADLSSGAPAWSVVRRGELRCHGIGLDAPRRRLYLLEGETATGCELVAVDLSGPGGARDAGRTSGLAGRSAERWALSPSGAFAAVPTMLLEGGALRIVDTDPASATHLAIAATAQVPPIEGFSFCGAIAVTADEQWVFLAFAGTAVQGLLRFHVPTRRWIDFDPSREGVQPHPSPGPVPTALAASPDGSYLVAIGQGQGGWAARIHLDRWDPAALSHAMLLRGSRELDGATTLALSPDGARAAIAGSRAGRLLVVDVLRDELAGSIPLVGGGSFGHAAWCGSDRDGGGAGGAGGGTKR